MGRRSESTEFLLGCISEALLTLMKEKDYRKITINEIVELAGVSRMTYFRNFSTKEDILVWKLKGMWKQWAKEYHLKAHNRFNLDNALSFFQFNYENREFLKFLYNAGESAAVLGVFQSVFSEDVETSSQEYISAFVQFGLFGMLNRWVLNDFAESPEEMVRIGSQIQVIEKN